MLTRNLMRGIWIPALAILFSNAVLAADPTPNIHLGVPSCSGSTCHGAVSPWRDSNVAQDEYRIWKDRDHHSRAYATLLTERSQRIAKNLGLPNANEAKICLDCHADNVPAAQRGPQFQISDGVGCEACHGGGERWLGIHISGHSRHPDNLAAGMFPTEDPVRRAEMCLNCHFGDETRFATHRIMGAGHPRIAFELDTFTAIEPAHYKDDAKYRARKSAASDVKVWAIGQAIAERKLMTAIADPKRNHDGIFPEFVLYDCEACHHPTTNVGWRPRETEMIRPGVIRLQDQYDWMLKLIARETAPALSPELVERSRALHEASLKDRETMEHAASAVAETADRLVRAFAARDFGAADTAKLWNAMLAEGGGEGFPDYASAEQATMALGAMIEGMRKDGDMDAAHEKAVKSALEACYAAVAKAEYYKSEVFSAALRQVQQAAR